MTDVTLPYVNGLDCGCTELTRCERHALMQRELARRYHRPPSAVKSSTIFENASKPSSAPGSTGPR
jgi:hypothetical protein